MYLFITVTLVTAEWFILTNVLKTNLSKIGTCNEIIIIILIQLNYFI